MDYVILNVSGTIFRLHKKTFCRLPSNCFENCVSNQLKMDEKDSCEEYYLERHAESFTAIVWFYTNGELHMPSSVCPSVFCRELKFWQIDDRKMSRCCYMKYVSFFEDQALLKTFELEETKAGRSGNILRPSNSKWEYTRRKVWRVLDDPMSSALAKVQYYDLSRVLHHDVVMICLSCIDETQLTHLIFFVTQGFFCYLLWCCCRWLNNIPILQSIDSLSEQLKLFIQLLFFQYKIRIF